MRYFKVTSLSKFRLKRRTFSALKVRVKWVKSEKSGQNLGYDIYIYILILLSLNLIFPSINPGAVMVHKEILMHPA